MASVEIFLLSLAFQNFLDEMYSSLIDGLSRSAQLKRAKSASGAINYLEANNPRAILVTDEGLTEAKNRAVLENVMSYVRNGGLVIVGLHFPNFATFDVINGFFETFGLPWRSGNYHRDEFQLNPTCSLPRGVASNRLLAPYSMKALHVKNARPDEKIFVPVADDMTLSNVFPPRHIDNAQAAVVGAKVGDGYLVYIGDVNGEKGSDNIILSLCGF